MIAIQGRAKNIFFFRDDSPSIRFRLWRGFVTLDNISRDQHTVNLGFPKHMLQSVTLSIITKLKLPFNPRIHQEVVNRVKSGAFVLVNYGSLPCDFDEIVNLSGESVSLR